MTAKQPTDLKLTDKAFRFMAHAIERRFYADGLIVSDLTPFDEIYRDGIMSVRHYPPLVESEIRIGDRRIPVSRQRHRVPVVLVPPLAATSMIFDLLPQRSLVRFLLAHGFDVYLIDWGTVTDDHADLSLESYVLDWMPGAIAQVRAHSGQPEVSLFAYCMGGLLALMYAATAREGAIRNLVTVATPVDMHQSGVAGRVFSAVGGPARWLSQRLNVSLMDLPAKYLHIPGWMNSTLFKLTNPVASLTSYRDLLLNLWDREFLQEHTTVSSWFDDMVDYPGETVKGMLVRLMLNNQMAKGRMRLRGQPTLFENIQCSILAFAGDTDHLVSIRAVRKVLDIVSSQDKSVQVMPGGHAGVFAGSRAPEHMWQASVDWLVNRSD